MSKHKLAIVRVRGIQKIETGIRDTLTMLQLHKKNFCVIYDENPTLNGMLTKVKDYVTWGEVSDDVISELTTKRGVVSPKDKKKYKPFRLAPPQKGYGRGGIKVPFKMGGALGYRGEKINDLIKRML